MPLSIVIAAKKSMNPGLYKHQKYKTLCWKSKIKASGEGCFLVHIWLPGSVDSVPFRKIS